MFFVRTRSQKRDTALGLDLGSSQIKAAVVHRNGDKLELADYAVRILPENGGKPYRNAQFVDEIQRLLGELKLTERRAYVTISCGSAMVCQTEVPKMPLEEIRGVLKLNSSKYLRRDFSNYYLDAVEMPGRADGDKNAAKISVLVGGASREEVAGYRDALLAAKVRPEVLELAAVSVINAFGLTKPDLADEMVLLLDIGARSTTINFLRDSQPLITRIMPFGGEQISEYIGQVMLVDAKQAESEKLNMSAPVQELVRTAISPLAREVRSSIDYLERQHDCHVSRMFACGGSACSPRLLELLGEGVGLRIECWNPVETLGTSHLNGTQPRLAAVGPSLAAAVGAAAAHL